MGGYCTDLMDISQWFITMTDLAISIFLDDQNISRLVFSLFTPPHTFSLYYIGRVRHSNLNININI